ncbi:unnamed protein product, partial [Dibothriocephalus latus]
YPGFHSFPGFQGFREPSFQHFQKPVAAEYEIGYPSRAMEGTEKSSKTVDDMKKL